METARGEGGAGCGTGRRGKGYSLGEGRNHGTMLEIANAKPFTCHCL